MAVFGWISPEFSLTAKSQKPPPALSPHSTLLNPGPNPVDGSGGRGNGLPGLSVLRTSRFRRFIAALLFVSIPLTTVGYDADADNPTVTHTRSVHNSYDANYRLRSETIVQDGAVSRSRYDYDHGNNRVALRKDTGGDGADDEIFSDTADYHYDLENRLVQLDDGQNDGSLRSHHYAYDYRARRVVRDESLGGGQSTTLVFSGGLSVREWESAGLDQKIADPVNSAAEPDSELIRGSDWGGGVGGVLYTLRLDGGVLRPGYHHFNGRGDVVAKTDADGAFAWQASYEAFGTRTREVGTNPDRHRASELLRTASSQSKPRHAIHILCFWRAKEVPDCDAGGRAFGWQRRKRLRCW